MKFSGKMCLKIRKIHFSKNQSGGGVKLTPPAVLGLMLRRFLFIFLVLLVAYSEMFYKTLLESEENICGGFPLKKSQVAT